MLIDRTKLTFREVSLLAAGTSITSLYYMQLGRLSIILMFVSLINEMLAVCHFILH